MVVLRMVSFRESMQILYPISQYFPSVKRVLAVECYDAIIVFINYVSYDVYDLITARQISNHFLLHSIIINKI
jgi:hypothetical protein